ncbi:hypothetical protein [Meiothermus rufus]|uniref:hypothetical protein n=1 Tax=Meiothermus rufus TaxID=604332 RepID=UPI00040E000E|nr:hypothetical protein [Meiothermus rufus]
MKKLIPLMAAALMLAGCGNFVTDFGIPTVRFNNTFSGPTSSGYTIEFEVQPYPGSPSAQITRLLLSGPPNELPGLSVPECPASTLPDDCPKILRTLTFAANPGPLSITGYEAMSLNGSVRVVNLPAPHLINR